MFRWVKRQDTRQNVSNLGTSSTVPIIGTMKKTIASPDYRKLISWLKKSREDQGLSMRALAEKLDVPHSFVQKIETMERRLDVMEYVWYCNELGVDAKEGLVILTSKTRLSSV